MIADLVGCLVDLHPDPTRLLTPTWAAVCAAPADAAVRPSVGRVASMFRDEVSAMLPALFFGAAVAGLIQVAVSRETLIGVGGHPVYGVLALIALAFVVAICSNVDAFFALSLASTFSPGALIAFLVFGPMIVRFVSRFRALCERSGFVENFDARSGAGLRDRAYTWTASVYLVFAHDYTQRGVDEIALAAPE